MALVAVIGRQLILGDTPAQETATSSDSPAAETINIALNDTRSPDHLLVEGKDYQLEDQRFFENESWMVAAIVPIPPTEANDATIVLKRANTTYEVILGPGTDFSQDDLQQLPSEVAQYITKK
jgi:hypothetical protein